MTFACFCKANNILLVGRGIVNVWTARSGGVVTETGFCLVVNSYLHLLILRRDGAARDSQYH